MGNRRICELCNDQALAYCESDSAYLCFNCDAKVHGANFLVARHIRKIICSNCEDFTGDQISGLGFPPETLICSSCSPTELDSGELDSLSSSSSSACVSSSHSFSATARKKSLPAGAVNGGQRVKWEIDSKTVGIFVHWCKRLGLDDDVAAVVVRMACNGVAVCGGKLTVLPFRICLVASLWFGLKSSRTKSLSGSQALSRLEQITGLPAKLISSAELKIERLYNSAKERQNYLQSQHDELLKEGWAEST